MVISITILNETGRQPLPVHSTSLKAANMPLNDRKSHVASMACQKFRREVSLGSNNLRYLVLHASILDRLLDEPEATNVETKELGREAWFPSSIQDSPAGLAGPSVTVSVEESGPEIGEDDEEELVSLKLFSSALAQQLTPPTPSRDSDSDSDSSCDSLSDSADDDDYDDDDDSEDVFAAAAAPDTFSTAIMDAKSSQLEKLLIYDRPKLSRSPSC